MLWQRQWLWQWEQLQQLGPQHSWVPLLEDLLGLEEMAQSPEISDAHFLRAKAAERWSPETLGSRWGWWAAVKASVSVSPCRSSLAGQGDRLHSPQGPGLWVQQRC